MKENTINSEKSATNNIKKDDSKLLQSKEPSNSPSKGTETQENQNTHKTETDSAESDDNASETPAKTNKTPPRTAVECLSVSELTNGQTIVLLNESYFGHLRNNHESLISAIRSILITAQSIVSTEAQHLALTNEIKRKVPISTEIINPNLIFECKVLITDQNEIELQTSFGPACAPDKPLAYALIHIAEIINGLRTSLI